MRRFSSFLLTTAVLACQSPQPAADTGVDRSAPNAAPAPNSAPLPDPAPDAAPAPARVDLPDSRVGAFTRSWLDAMNQGDAAALRAFLAPRISQHILKFGPIEQWTDYFVALSEQSGGLDIIAVGPQPPQPSDIVFTVRSRRGHHHAVVQFILDEQDALHDFIVLPKPFPGETDPDALPVVAMSEAEVVQAIGRRVDGLAAADRFSGAVLVVKGDRELVSLARGRAEQAFAADNRIDTRFNLGSMNKMFTAVAVAQLVERGELSFTDSLARALPDYPNREFAERVTVHQLLTHTSGIGGDIFAPPVYEHRDRYKRAADYIPLFADKPPEFPPGARFGYANPGFMTLGRIVEHVSGEAYDDYVKTHIFAPAGMHATAAVDWDEVAPNLAVGYGREESDPLGLRPRRANVSYLPFRGTPAGGGYSTVLDLVAFVRALRGHVLLGEAMTETVTGPKVEAPMFGPEGRYGYGFWSRVVRGKEVRGHGGGHHGINGQLEFFADGSYVVAVLGNYDPPAAMSLAGEIVELLAVQPRE